MTIRALFIAVFFAAGFAGFAQADPPQPPLPVFKAPMMILCMKGYRPKQLKDGKRICVKVHAK